MLQTDMPYERFIQYGPGSLTDSELLAIIIRTGTKEKNSMQLAQDILKLSNTKEKGLNCLYDLSIHDLMKIKGIGKVKAIKLKCIAELSLRMAKETSKQSLSFKNASSIANYYMEEMRHLSREQVMVLMLDNKCHLIKDITLSVGTVNMSVLSPREVFVETLKTKACSFIVLHNHPSGDPTPSSTDLAITRQLNECGTLMDIKLIDHIIIGDGVYFSFKEKGYL